MRYFSKLLAIAAFFGASANVFSQGLEVYGFMQPLAMKYNEKFTITAPFLNQAKMKMETQQKEITKDYNSFSLQQANLMARNDFGSGFSAFLNLEFTNNYSSNNGWGDLNLQEAFLRYEYNNYLKVKVGQFIPAFNNLYEIYNRTPLLPYVFRPYAYETMVKSILSSSTMLPTRAFLQIEGAMPAGDANIDYAFYLGNAGDKFMSSNNNEDPNDLTPVYGTQVSKYITAGARLGLRYSTLKAGVSFAQDRNDLTQTQISMEGVPLNLKNMGTPTRYKIGGDFQYSIEGFTLLGELIYAKTNVADVFKDSLKVWSKFSPDLSTGYVDEDVNAMFYYATLQYDINPELFVYGTTTYWKNTLTGAVASGATGISGGIGFKPIDQAVIKLQYQINKIDGEEYSTPVVHPQAGNLGDAKYKLDYESTYLMLGISVAF